MTLARTKDVEKGFCPDRMFPVMARNEFTSPCVARNNVWPPHFHHYIKSLRHGLDLYMNKVDTSKNYRLVGLVVVASLGF